MKTVLLSTGLFWRLRKCSRLGFPKLSKFLPIFPLKSISEFYSSKSCYPLCVHCFIQRDEEQSCEASALQSLYRCNATSFNLFQNKFLSSIHYSFSIISVPKEHQFHTEKGVYFWKFKTCSLSPTAKETKGFFVVIVLGKKWYALISYSIIIVFSD